MFTVLLVVSTFIPTCMAHSFLARLSEHSSKMLGSHMQGTI